MKNKPISSYSVVHNELNLSSGKLSEDASKSSS